MTMTLLHVLCIMIVSSSLKEHAAVNDDDEDSRLGCEDGARGINERQDREREKAKNINNKNNTYNTRRIGGGGGGGGEYRKEGKVKKLRVSFPTAGWVDDSDDDDDDR